MIALHSLRISRRHISGRARRLRRRRRRGTDKAALLAGELGAGRAAIHGAIALLLSGPPLAAVRVLRLALHVVVCDCAALLFVRHLLVGGVGCDGDDVPGVEEAGEEAEHCGRGLC